MTDPIREAQAHLTALRRLARAEQKVLASVKARYDKRRAELDSGLSGAARRLLEAMEEGSSEDE